MLTANAVKKECQPPQDLSLRTFTLLALPPMVARIVEQKTYPIDQPFVILFGMENKGPTP